MLPTIINVDEFRRDQRHKPPCLSSLPLTASVLAFDPGGETGWSLMHVHPEALLPEEPDVTILGNIEEWQHGEIDCHNRKRSVGLTRVQSFDSSGECAGANECINLIRAWPGAIVVLEDFILEYFSKARDLLSPPRLNSVLQFHCWQNHRRFFLQMPAEKPEASDERLKEWGMYDSRGGLGHARDADRHALIFLRKAMAATEKGQRIREWAWPHLYAPGGEYWQEPPQAAVG